MHVMTEITMCEFTVCIAMIIEINYDKLLQSQHWNKLFGQQGVHK